MRCIGQNHKKDNEAMQWCVQVPGVSPEHQLLAHCYAAEALCNLDSPQQAAQQLQTAVALQGITGSPSPGRSAAAPGASAATAASQVRHASCADWMHLSIGTV